MEDTVEVDGADGHLTIIGCIIYMSLAFHIPTGYQNSVPHSLCINDYCLSPVQLFLTPEATTTCAEHPWISVDPQDAEACSKIVHTAETICLVWLPIDLVVQIVFLLPISNFTNHSYDPLHGRYHTYNMASRTNFIFDDTLYRWMSRFSVIQDEYRTFGANSSASCLVVYTLRTMHALQAESI